MSYLSDDTSVMINQGQTSKIWQLMNSYQGVA